MAEKELPTPEEMQEMAEIDIRTVDTSSLVDIEQVQIQTELPQEERIADYIRQIKNPYCYISHGVAVKISFTGKCTLEESLYFVMKMKKNRMERNLKKNEKRYSSEPEVMLIWCWVKI